MYMKTLFSQNQRDGMPAVSVPGTREGFPELSRENSMENRSSMMENRPVTPLPNPGEGGAVSGGNNSSGMEGSTGNNGAGATQENNQLVTPLPNPGEGGPAFPGITEGSTGGTSGGTTGGIIGGIIGDLGNRPVTPLPNPGEGGPVYPGTTGGTGGGLGGLNVPSIIGTIITTFPRPNAPCRFCANQSQTYGNVRFLNAAAGYNPFRVYINDQLFVSPLNFSEVTSYEKVPSGYQIVTIMGDNQYIHVQKPVMVPRDGSITVAICNTENGIDLFVISDTTCNRSSFVSCMRVCNLSVNSGPLSVVLGNNELRFMNVAYQEISNFKVITPSNYIFYVINGNRNIILSSSVDVKADVSYTMYLFNWNISSPDAITVLIVEEHS